MRNLTRIQRITVALFIAYVVWEAAVYFWRMSLPPHDPIIRGDLVLILPVLLLFLAISIYQYAKK